MLIGIDGHLLGKGKGGSELVLRMIVENIPRLLPEDKFILFVTREFGNKEYLLTISPNMMIVYWPIAHPAIQRLIFAPLYMHRFKLDLFHVQRLLPLIRPCKTIVTIHDLLPLVQPELNKGINHRFVRYFTRYSAKHADQIITGSMVAKNEIANICKITPEKIQVCYNGIDFKKYSPKKNDRDKEYLKERYNMSSDYLLYFGPIVERKNIHILIEAFHEWKQKSSNCALLVIAGILRSLSYKEKLLKMIDESTNKNCIRFLGKVDEAHVQILVRNAKLFFAPSKGEGFDLPPIEAMASGVPVICSDIEVHRELLSKCAIFYKTDSVDALCKAIEECWDDTQKCTRLVNTATKMIQKFSWNTMALAVANVYKKVGMGN